MARAIQTCVLALLLAVCGPAACVDEGADETPDGDAASDGD